MKQFVTVLKYSFKEQMTNRFAFGLLIVFVPIWFWLLGIITPSAPLAFKFRPTHTYLHASGHDITLITAGLNLLTMILGFMFFHSIQRSLDFDKRLTRAGLSRFWFIVGSTIALLAVTAVVALYMILILLLFWPSPHNIFEIWLGFWLVSITYGSLGRIIGMILNSELPGFFFIVMFSMIDVFLQNPLGNPAANKPFLQFFPSYSAMQLSVAGGFTHIFAGSQVLLALSWLISFFLISLVLFYFRTKITNSIQPTPVEAGDEKLRPQPQEL